MNSTSRVSTSWRLDQPAVVVEQNLGRHPAEVPERALQPLQPALLALVAGTPARASGARSPASPRTGTPSSKAPDQDAPLAEVDLQLVARRRLEADRRPRLGRQLTPQRRHLPLDRPQAQRDALLGQKLLTHHVGVAGMPPEALGQPFLEPRQRTRPADRRR